MDQMEEALQRKEKYLSENKEYQKQESLLHKHTAGKYIGDLIYGANDGIVTTFAVVAGAAGASFSNLVVVILGFANLFADGFSMGASNFLGQRSEQDYAKAQKKKEEWEIDHLRELEKDEVREIFEKKGFRGQSLEEAVKIITSDRKVWVDTMMRDELDIITDINDDPKKHGIVTFLAFIIAGFFPLIPYLLPNLPDRFLYSAIIGALTLFFVGASRSLITTVNFLRGGLEMLLVGSTAAIVAYAVGEFIGKLAK